MSLTIWKQLTLQKIDCETALQRLVDPHGHLSVAELDPELNQRFWRYFPGKMSFAVIPLLLWRNCYYLGSPTTLSPDAIATLKERTGSEIEIIPISTESYRVWYRKQYADKGSAVPAINPLTGEREQENISETTQHQLAKADDQIERIKTLLTGALRNRASDIHLEPTLEGLRVRYRIDGVLRDITTLPLEQSRRAIVAIKVMSNMDISESRRPQDGRIEEKYATDAGKETGTMDMRVSTLPCINGEKAVIRLLPRENPFTKMDNLGFSNDVLATYTSWLTQPQGMIILTGPTGSGKTSTLYASLQTVAKENVNVVTVEDPVEYVLPRITQTQVNEAAGMTFATGLRAILRQDPDIIMLGEIRDAETAETAIRAALTGHLVFTTLHTNDAVGAIPRLKDIGPDPGLISDALLGIVAQRLVRHVCPHCSEPYTPTSTDLRILGITEAEANFGQWRKGKGCSACFHSGYLGREAVVEVLNVDERVREIIYEGTMIQLHRYLQESNFASFQTGAVEKVTSGITTVEEVARVIPRSAFRQKTTRNLAIA